jgi:hypothetical protein
MLLFGDVMLLPPCWSYETKSKVSIGHLITARVCFWSHWLSLTGWASHLFGFVPPSSGDRLVPIMGIHLIVSYAHDRSDTYIQLSSALLPPNWSPLRLRSLQIVYLGLQNVLLFQYLFLSHAHTQTHTHSCTLVVARSPIGTCWSPLWQTFGITNIYCDV